MKKIKEIFKKNKSIFITGLLGLTLGFSLYNNPSLETINGLKAENQSYLTSIDEHQTDLSSLESSIEEIKNKTSEVSTFISKQEEILNNKQKELEEKKKKEEEAKRIAEEKAKQEEAIKKKSEEEKKKKDSFPQDTSGSSNTSKSDTNTSQPENKGIMVYKTATGSKYHSINNCGKTNPNNTSYITIEKAKSIGLTACSKCY